MTVSTTTTTQKTTGAGGILAFPFTWRCDDSAWVKVYLGGVLQAAGYSLEVNDDQASAPGGTVTFDVAPDGLAIEIRREIPLLQEVDYGAYDAFPAETHELALDRGVLADQDIVRDYTAADAAERAARIAADQALAAAIAQGPGGGSGTLVIATGSTTARTLADRAADVVNVLDFGADPTGTTASDAAFAAAVDAATELAPGRTDVRWCRKAIVIPGGHYRLAESWDLTNLLGLTLVGAGRGSTAYQGGVTKITGTVEDRPIIDCAGSRDIVASDLMVMAEQAAGAALPPACCVLMSRTVTLPSCGLHDFSRVILSGGHLAAVIALESEVNKWTDCWFQTSYAGAPAFYTGHVNGLGVVSDYETIPSPQAGGNTMHIFWGCGFQAADGDGFNGQVTNARFENCYTVADGDGYAQFRFRAAQNVVISAHRDEGNATYGIYFEPDPGTRALGIGDHYNISLHSSYIGPIYAPDDVEVFGLSVISSFVFFHGAIVWALDVDVLRYSDLCALLNVRIRTAATRNSFAAFNPDATYSFPTNQSENVVGGQVLGGASSVPIMIKGTNPQWWNNPASFPLKYWKTIDGGVHFTGWVHSNSADAGTVPVFVLPAGCRPDVLTNITVMAGGPPYPGATPVAAEIRADGEVWIPTATSGTNFAFEGVLFGADGAVVTDPLVQAAAQVDSVATTVAALVADFNSLLAKLRTANIVAP